MSNRSKNDMKEVNLVIPIRIHEILKTLKDQQIIPSISEGIRFCLYNQIDELAKLINTKGKVLKPNKIKNGQLGENTDIVFIRKGNKYIRYVRHERLNQGFFLMFFSFNSEYLLYLSFARYILILYSIKLNFFLGFILKLNQGFF